MDVYIVNSLSTRCGVEIAAHADSPVLVVMSADRRQHVSMKHRRTIHTSWVNEGGGRSIAS
ncbi:hypothetical protein [Paenibacillus marinisediminis]